MYYTAESAFNGYELLDCGGGAKLERWGEYTLIRPDPQALWEPLDAPLWAHADAVYRRSNEGGGEWVFNRKLPDRWVVSYKDLKFYVRPTGFKHMGLFPEQAPNWDYMRSLIAGCGRRIKVLNLFAYTGAATVACASAGAAVTHVDAAKGMNAWAKENLALSGLKDAPVRFLTDDCIKFILREQRRQNTYDAIIMDPPSYGRGAGGKVFKTEEHIAELVRQAAKLLSDWPLFFIINSYTTGLSYLICRNLLHIWLDGGKIEGGDLAIASKTGGILLPCGTATRWTP